MTSSDKYTEAEELDATLKLLSLFSQNLRDAISNKRSGSEDYLNNIPERAASLLMVMSAVIRTRCPNWDATSVELLQEELTNISRGAAPDLLARPLSAPNAAPLKVETNEHHGRLYAAIVLLERHGLKKEEALKFVANKVSVPVSTLRSLYKRMRSNEKSPKTIHEAETLLKIFLKLPNKKQAALHIIRQYRKLKN